MQNKRSVAENGSGSVKPVYWNQPAQSFLYDLGVRYTAISCPAKGDEHPQKGKDDQAGQSQNQYHQGKAKHWTFCDFKPGWHYNETSQKKVTKC